MSIFSGISILNHCFLGRATGGVFCHCPSPQLDTCRQGEWPHQSIKLQKNVSTAVSDLAFLDCTVALNKSLRNKLSSLGWCWGGERQVMKDPGFYNSHQTEIYQCSHQLVISDLTWQARLLVNFLSSRKGREQTYSVCGYTLLRWVLSTWQKGARSGGATEPGRPERRHHCFTAVWASCREHLLLIARGVSCQRRGLVNCVERRAIWSSFAASALAWLP